MEIAMTDCSPLPLIYIYIQHFFIESFELMNGGQNDGKNPYAYLLFPGLFVNKYDQTEKRRNKRIECAFRS